VIAIRLAYAQFLEWWFRQQS